MDYSKILKIDENTTIVDVIGIYEVLLKRIGKKKKLKDTDINEIVLTADDKLRLEIL